MIMNVASAPMRVVLLVVSRAAVPVLEIRHPMYVHLAQILAEDPVTQTVPQRVAMNVREYHQWDVQTAQLIALGNVLKPVPIHARPKHHNFVQIVLAIAQLDVRQPVQTLVRPRHRNPALIVQATALLNALPPARIRVRLKPHKDVKDAVIHAKQAVEDNATGLVVALVINSVKVPV